MVGELRLFTQATRQTRVGRLQRTHDARADTFERAVEQRQRRQIDARRDVGRARHFKQVAEQPEAGHVGARACAIAAQALAREPAGYQHRSQRKLQPATLCSQPRVRRQQRTGADRLGQHQRVAHAHAALAQHAGERFVDQAVDGKSECDLAPFAGVPADQRTLRCVENLHRTGHHLRHQFSNLVVQPRWHGRNGGGALGFGTHRVDVAERMVGGNLAEEIGVFVKGPEEVHRVHHRLAPRYPDDGGIVWCIQSHQHVVALDRPQSRERAGQHAGPDFRATTAAAHVVDRTGLHPFLDRQPGVERRCRKGLGGGHGRKPLVAVHEAPVDPVFPAPNPSTRESDPPARRHGISITGADERQPMFLRPVRQQGSSGEDAAQVLRQRTPHPHREHAGLFEPAALHAGDIARGEHQRVVDRAQAVVYLNEPVLVQDQPGVPQPCRAARVGDPDRLVDIDPIACLGPQSDGLHLRDRSPPVHLHTARGKHCLEATLHPAVVGRQDMGVGAEQMEHYVVRITPQRAQLGMQAVLHGQQQLHATSPAPDHRDGAATCVPAYPLQQREPALVELEDRLHRHSMGTCAGHPVPLWCRADVDRQGVVGNGRTVAQHQPARRAVDAGCLGRYQSRAGKATQSRQVNVDLVERIVACDIAGQHARVRGVDIVAHQREPKAGHWPHAEVAQQHRVAVAAAYQHGIAQYR